MLTRTYSALLLALLLVSRCLADTCPGPSQEPATNAGWRVEGRYDQDQKAWLYIETGLTNGTCWTGRIDRIEAHAHLYFFLSADGRRFAVLDPMAGRRIDRRFLIYDSGGKLIASLGVTNILNKAELDKMQHTQDHVNWLKFDRATRTYGAYLPARNAIQLTTLAGRKVPISLTDGRILSPEPPKPKRPPANAPP